MTKARRHSVAKSETNDYPSKQSPVYFTVAILGFSFWFLMAMPFASHRETYSWLAGVSTRTLAEQVSFGVSSTYRPISQGVIWFLFLFLDAGGFPTSATRQAVLQCSVYALFVLAWWLIYSAAPQRRIFAVVALVAGAVLFSGYVHLFHVYGLMYVPVMLTLGASINVVTSSRLEDRAVWYAAVAILLTLWHPFATALFVSCYSGWYLETFRRRDLHHHLVAILIVSACLAAILAVVVLFPRDSTPLDLRVAGFFASYQTNELNALASVVIVVLSLFACLSMSLSPNKQWAGVLFVSTLGGVLFWTGFPLLFLWFGVVAVKLFWMRLWSLLFLMLTATILPLGGATGTPIHTLFGIIVATYVTPLGWVRAERMLVVMRPRYAFAATLGALALVLLIRVGIDVPIITRVANPLLAERERTYQLENILAWLHNSPYCDSAIAFSEKSASPAESVEDAIRRRNRPPAHIEDVEHFWNTVLRCQSTDGLGRKETAVVTFGGSPGRNLTPVHQVNGRYAGTATVWIDDGRQQ